MSSKVGYLKYRGEGTHEGGRGDPCKEGEEAPMAGVVGTYGGHHMPGASGGVGSWRRNHALATQPAK